MDDLSDFYICSALHSPPPLLPLLEKVQNALNSAGFMRVLGCTTRGYIKTFLSKLPDILSLLNTYTGHPKWCWCLSLGTLAVLQNLDIGHSLLFAVGELFLESLAALRAYGHRCVVIASGHLL